MKALFSASLMMILIACQPAFAGWVTGTEIGVRDDNSKAPIAIFVSAGLTPSSGPAAGSWNRINVVSALGMPTGVKSVFLTGLLIITHGSTAQTCNLTLAVRAPGDTLAAGNYICQAIEAHLGGGQRSGCSTWAPVVNDEIEIQWDRNTFTDWPTECAYGINLSAQSYVK